MEQQHFEDVEPGDEFEESWTATRAHVMQYIESGRNGMAGIGRFTDAVAAASEGLEGPVVPGPMSMAIMTRAVTDWMGMYGKLRRLDVNFRRPVHHGDHLRVLTLVTDVEESDGRPTVKLDVYFENERGERPLQGVAVVELPRRT